MPTSPAPDFRRLLARLTEALSERDLPFMLIGGQAVLLHGEPRLTQDIDITLGVGPSRLEDVLVACRAIDLRSLPEDPEAFVATTFVLPVEDAETGIRVDVIFSTTPYEAQAIGRAVHVLIEDRQVPFASAEDLVIHKLFAGRPRDLEDAGGVARRLGETLDWRYIRHWAEAFAEVPGQEELTRRVARLEHEHGP